MLWLAGIATGDVADTTDIVVGVDMVCTTVELLEV